MSSPRDEIEARLVLLGLPRLGPRRARWLTEGRSAAEVVATFRQRHLLAARAEAPTGVDQALVEVWFSWARRLDGAAMLEQHEAAGISIIGPDDEHWPLVAEPDPPLLLFGRGRLRNAGRALIPSSRRGRHPAMLDCRSSSGCDAGR